MKSLVLFRSRFKRFRLRRIVTAIPLLIALVSAAPAQTVDRVVVLKSARTMSLYSHNKLLKEYKIALGGSPVGPKQKMGDHKTPEGTYIIDAKNAHSQYHLSLHVSYPNAADRERAKQMKASPGGDIMIHGLPPKFHNVGALHRQWDWTDGCIAVTDEEIEEIWPMVPVGTKVEILP